MAPIDRLADIFRKFPDDDDKARSLAGVVRDDYDKPRSRAGDIPDDYDKPQTGDVRDDYCGGVPWSPTKIT
jgi:hypothetical protein